MLLIKTECYRIATLIKTLRQTEVYRVKGCV